MSDSTRRAIRTLFDLVPAVAAALLIVIPALGMDAAKAAWLAAVIAALTLALSKIRNALEDAGLIPAILKRAPADAPESPVT